MCDQLNNRHTNGACRYNNAVEYNQILHTSLWWLEAQYKWELEPPKDTPARPIGCLWSHAIVNQNPKGQRMSINSKCQFNISMLFEQCMIILTIEIKTSLAWRWCLTYGRDVDSYCYLCFCNLCRPPWLTSSGVAPECLLNQWLFLSYLVTSKRIVFVLVLHNQWRHPAIKMTAIIPPAKSIKCFCNHYAIWIVIFWRKSYWNLNFQW